MYQVITNLVIQQIPTEEYKDRTLKLTIPFVHSYSGSSSWANLSSGLKIVLPKNVKIFDGDKNKIVLANVDGKNSNIGGFDGSPLLLQGDMVTFNVGYRTKLMGNGGNEIMYMTGEPDPMEVYSDNIPVLFQGFISKVSSRLPFTIECEDAMWLLKQITSGAPKQRKETNIIEIVQEILDSSKASEILSPYKDNGVDISIADYSKSDLVFNMQDFWTHGESLAKILARVKTEYQLECWFRGYELRIGLTYYIPDDAMVQSFTFMQNILDGDTLAFVRVDDNIQSVDVKTSYEAEDEGGAQTKDGQVVTHKQSTEVVVYIDPNKDYAMVEKEKGVDLDIDDIGTRLSWTLNGTTEMGDGATVDVTSTTDLFNIGVRILKKKHYNGLQGTITTFGVPYVKHGDVINLTHPVLPEMSGMYMCKSVEYAGGAEEGLRQTITLDFKIDSLSDIDAFA